jgi:hypothetical protein
MTMDIQSTTSIQPTSDDIGYNDFGDIAFALAAYQMQTLDLDLSCRLEDIKRLTEVKKAYRNQILGLRQKLEEMGDDETVTLSGDLASKAEFRYDPETGEVINAATESIGEEFHTAIESEPSATYTTGAPVGDFGAVRSFASGLEGVVVNSKANKEQIENEIARLEGRIDELSGEGEIGLLAINRLMSKRNQVMQLASNVLSSSHQTAMGVISNIK